MDRHVSIGLVQACRDGQRELAELLLRYDLLYEQSMASCACQWPCNAKLRSAERLSLQEQRPFFVQAPHLRKGCWHRHGADACAEDFKGNTPAHIAAAQGHIVLLTKLLQVCSLKFFLIASSH